MTRTKGHNCKRRWDLWDLSMYGDVDATDCCPKKQRHNTTKWRSLIQFNLKVELEDYADDHDIPIHAPRLRI